jgi:biotin operon repressor
MSKLRQCAVACWLMDQSPEPWPAHLLAKRFHVTEMTIKRDVTELRRMGIPVESNHEGYVLELDNYGRCALEDLYMVHYVASTGGDVLERLKEIRWGKQ